MPIDFNTPNPTNQVEDPIDRLTPFYGKLDAKGGKSGLDSGHKPYSKFYIFCYITALALSVTSFYLSIQSVSKMYGPKPIIVQCDQSVVENIRKISEKMNKISLDKDEK